MSLHLAAPLEDSVDSRLPIDVLLHHLPGEHYKPPPCLFFIRAITGLITPALTLVLSHLPAPRGEGQAPLTHIRCPYLPDHAKTRVLPIASGNFIKRGGR